MSTTYMPITFDFPPSIGGIQTRVENYVKNLVKTGHHVLVVHLVEPEEWQKHFESAGRYVIIERVHSSCVLRFRYPLKETFKIFLAVLRYPDRRRMNVVHVFSGINLFIGNLFLTYGRLKGCKVVEDGEYHEIIPLGPSVLLISLEAIPNAPVR